MRPCTLAYADTNTQRSLVVKGGKRKEMGRRARDYREEKWDETVEAKYFTSL